MLGAHPDHRHTAKLQPLHGVHRAHTHPALEEVVRAARRRLRVVEELTLAARRGVVVDLLLEDKTGALEAFKGPFARMAEQVRL